MTESMAYGVLRVAGTTTKNVAVARLSGRVLGALLYARLLHPRLLEAYEIWRVGPDAKQRVVRDSKPLAVSCCRLHCARCQRWPGPHVSAQDEFCKAAWGELFNARQSLSPLYMLTDEQQAAALTTIDDAAGKERALVRTAPARQAMLSSGRIFTFSRAQLANHDLGIAVLLIMDPDPRVYPDNYCPQMAFVLALMKPAPLSVRALCCSWPVTCVTSELTSGLPQEAASFRVAVALLGHQVDRLVCGICMQYAGKLARSGCSCWLPSGSERLYCLLQATS